LLVVPRHVSSLRPVDTFISIFPYLEQFHALIYSFRLFYSLQKANWTSFGTPRLLSDLKARDALKCSRTQLLHLNMEAVKR
jgi:hypothetical protein